MGGCGLAVSPRKPRVPYCEEPARSHTLQEGLAGRFRDAPAIPWFAGLAGDKHTWVGLDTLGTLRRYHPSGSEYLVTGWPQHNGGAVALLGRSSDTMVCGKANVLHTGVGLGTLCDTMRWAWFGPGCQGWDVSATPRHHCACALGNLQSGRFDATIRGINGCVRGTGRHCEEAGGDRQGSPRRERAKGHHHLYRGCHAFVVLRDRYDGRVERVQATHGWRPGQGLAVHVLRGTCVIQNPRLDSEAGSA